jgi:predicted RNA-binding Zn-ribbon protein involved in translation (DUF1610 family)
MTEIVVTTAGDTLVTTADDTVITTAATAVTGTRVTLFPADIRRGLQTFFCPTCGTTITRDSSQGARNPMFCCSARCFRRWRNYQGARENILTPGRASRSLFHGIQVPGPIQ